MTPTVFHLDSRINNISQVQPHNLQVDTPSACLRFLWSSPLQRGHLFISELISTIPPQSHM